MGPRESDNSVMREAAWVLAMLLRDNTGRAAVNHMRRLARRAGYSLDELSRMDAWKLLPLAHGPEEEAVRAFLQLTRRDRERAEKHLEFCQTMGVGFHLAESEHYPAVFAQKLGVQAPPLLFTCGELDLLTTPAAAVVGARRVTTEGGVLARRLGQTFAALGVTLVSGNADGVDSAAQEGAWQAGGSVIAVLPHGVGELREPRCLDQSLYISEFAPTAPWETHAAVTRNSAIAALARLVCVIEPASMHGSAETGRSALTHGAPALVEPHPRQPARANELRALGAGLLRPDGRLDPAYIEAAWIEAGAAAPPPAQGELFA